MSSRFLPILIFLALVLAAPRRGLAQAVVVTLRVDTNNIPIGGSTTLRVFGQVGASLRANAERIFSWYVDVLNADGTVAGANYGLMQKSASDNDSNLSSTGTSDGANRRGIYDTFLNLPGAGVATPVELMAIPITGLASGQTRFQVRAGTGVPALSDFLVNPLVGDAPLLGGDYNVARVDLQVGAGSCPIQLQFSAPAGTGLGKPLLLSFIPCPGRNHIVEFRDALNDVAGWRALPGAPHNSGSLTVTNTGLQRFFRVNSTPVLSSSDLRLNIAPLAGGPGQRLSLTFPIASGYNYTVEFRNDLAPATAWQSLPGAPHNSGSVTVTNTLSPQRFYRVRAAPL